MRKGPAKKKQSESSLLEKKEADLDRQVEALEEVEYGLKELIQGIVIGIILGFGLAWILLK